LPEDTSIETAQQIIVNSLSDNFGQKIKAEFPYLTDKQLSGLSINWRVLRMVGDEKSKLSIVIQMQHGGKLTAEDAEAVAEYARTIVEESVRVYFKMQSGKSSQQA
jgi:hypothetical protein